MRYAFLAVALALSGAATAAPLVNGGFEAPNLGVGQYSYTTQPDGWSSTGALVNAEGASAWYGATPPAGQEGAQFYALQDVSSIFQNFTVGQSGQLTISWLSAGRPQGSSYGGDQSYEVLLQGSGIEQDSLGIFTTTSGQAFTRLFATATVTPGQTYALGFRGLSTGDQTAFIDGVTASSGSAVPEPAAWAMMIVGVGLVGTAARRRSARLSFG